MTKWEFQIKDFTFQRKIDIMQKMTKITKLQKGGKMVKR